jgi:SAM-dependent methyltransferase
MSHVAMKLFELGMDRVVPYPEEWEALGRHDYTILNLGAGNKHIVGTVALDLPEWNAETLPIPYEDETVDAILAFHFLEHIQNVTFVLRECQRVLRPGGTLNIVVPYGMSDCALQDLDHKHRFTEDTWKNTFANPYYDKGDWHWRIGFNMIMGLVHRNLVLVTQLIKE